MQRSIYLARLIAPVLFAIGVGVLFNPSGFRAMAEEFLRSPALIFVSGLLTLTAGVAIVLAHNVWEGDWRLIITALGWLWVIGGAFRIVVPHMVEQVGTGVFAYPAVPMLAGGAFLVLAAVLGYFSYPEFFSTKPSRRTGRTRKTS